MTVAKNLTLVTPGPVKTPAIVRDYLVDPPCNYHRQEAFGQMFDDNQRDLKQLLGLRDPNAFFVTILLASGTGTNEAAIKALSLLGKGLIISNGFFGQRLAEQCAANATDHDVYREPHDRPIDVARLDAFLALAPGRYTWAYFVSHETRATMKNPLEDLGRMLKAHGLVVGVDCVSSAFAYPLEIEDAQLDLVVFTTSKALMAVPGLGLVLCRRTVMAAVAAARSSERPSYYLDLVGEYEKQSKDRAPRFGHPVELHAALRAACIHLTRVGIHRHHRRIQAQMRDLVAHLDGLGVTALLDPAYRSNVVVNFQLPPGLKYSEFQVLMAREGFYILYGLVEDPTMFQLCTMGDLSELDIATLKGAFDKVLAERVCAVA